MSLVVGGKPDGVIVTGRQVKLKQNASCCTGTLPAGDNDTTKWDNVSIWKRQPADSSWKGETVDLTGKWKDTGGGTYIVARQGGG